MGNVYLVGFMGTGKTSVGRELARRTKRQFVDLDELIELREKRGIPDIFAQEGEPYFRKAERQALKEVARQDDFIVACGGGIVLNEDNLKTMQSTGIVVCLTASVETILERTSRCSGRPLLNVPDPKKQAELLLKLRAPYYARADMAIDTTGVSIAEVVAAVAAVVPGKGKKRR